MIRDPAAWARAAASRAAQGLPPQVEDPAIIRQVVEAVLLARRLQAQRGDHDS